MPLAEVRKAVDMGCGPGNSTELIATRYPDAALTGLDSSPAMLAEARSRLPNARFELADAETWVPDGETDLVFANAIYQWVPGHLAQLPRVLDAMKPGGVLAVQMPDNVTEPSHQLMREVATEGLWAERLQNAARVPLPAPRVYWSDPLRPFGARRLDIWHTAYNHVLADAAAIVEWLRATGLRLFVDPLDEGERRSFLAVYQAKIAAAYPPTVDGKVLLRFPRLFLVAQR